MIKSLEKIHHIAIQVDDIEKSVSWYTSNFACAVSYEDASWALLKFENVSLALVLPNDHPPHFAVVRNQIDDFGQPIPHRDGTSSVYIKDPSDNSVEMLRLAD